MIGTGVSEHNLLEFILEEGIKTLQTPEPLWATGRTDSGTDKTQ